MMAGVQIIHNMYNEKRINNCLLKTRERERGVREREMYSSLISIKVSRVDLLVHG